MSAFGTLNVPWSIGAEANYDVIMDGISINNNSEQAMLADETGKRVTEVVFGENSEITLTATIKGSNHFGQNALVNSLISDISDADVPEPLIVVSNSVTKTKGEWSTCEMTCHYFGSSVTSGEASATIGTVAATTTSGA